MATYCESGLQGKQINRKTASSNVAVCSQLTAGSPSKVPLGRSDAWNNTHHIQTFPLNCKSGREMFALLCPHHAVSGSVAYILLCKKHFSFMLLCKFLGFPEEWWPVSHGGTAHSEEAHPALSTHPRHARPAAGDRRLHAHHWSLQVEQTQVQASVSHVYLYIRYWMNDANLMQREKQF